MKRLDPLDAAMVAVEPMSQPQHVGAVLVLSPPDDAGPGYVDQLYREALAATHAVDPRLRRYAYRGRDTRGMWVWRDAENLDLAQHVKRATLAADTGDFWQLIGELYAERLDRSLPMWTFHIIDGLDDGRFAFFVKVHHAVMDGVAGFRMIADGLSAAPARRDMPPIYGAHQDEARTESTPPRNQLPNPISVVRSLINAATSSAALVEKVVGAEITNVIASLTTDTTVAPVTAPFTRFNGRTGDARSVAAASWPRSRIRSVQDKTGVTSNDVVVAVVAGALRHWLRKHSELPEHSLVALCPITVRAHVRDGDDEHGNMFGAWLCPLGTDQDDAADRLDLIHRSMVEGKRQVASRGSGASLLLLVPTQVTTVLLPKTPLPKVRTGYNVPISNVPGPRSEMYWNGAHVEDIFPIGTVFDGLALTVTVCSYADRISFGYLAGRDVLPEIDELKDLTEQSLAEVEAAVGQ
ncbi:MAG: wax ester/triacylglycerol synthase family O-acyltransferase [Mycobacterium sp.]